MDVSIRRSGRAGARVRHWLGLHSEDLATGGDYPEDSLDCPEDEADYPKTTQKTASTTQKVVRDQILDHLRAEPALTRKALAERVGLTPDGVKYHLAALKEAGALRRVGSTRAGHWEVLRPGDSKS